MFQSTLGSLNTRISSLSFRWSDSLTHSIKTFFRPPARHFWSDTRKSFLADVRLSRASIQKRLSQLNSRSWATGFHWFTVNNTVFLFVCADWFPGWKMKKHISKQRTKQRNVNHCFCENSRPDLRVVNTAAASYLPTREYGTDKPLNC